MFKDQEKTRLVLKSIANNKILDTKVRNMARLELDKLDPRGSISRQHKICTMTGRRRGVIKHFGISRIKFRQLADQGLIPGVRRSSW